MKVKSIIKKYINKKTSIILLICFFAFGTTFILTYSEINNNVVNLNNTSPGGIDGSTVYVNDVTSDYYHYMGLNYTESDDGLLPSGENQNIYTENNLVQVRINYLSSNLDNSLKGYISNTERQDTFTYYKVYPINNNGTTAKNDDYIEIELIDNPFTDYPNNKGFNGWTTTNNEIEFSINFDYYKRYAKVPVTYVNDIASEIEVTFNASWTTAKVGYVNSNNSWDNAFNTLDTKGLKKVKIYGYQYADYDMTGYFYQTIISRGDSCAGMYNDRGQRQNNNCTCNAGSWFRPGKCTYYERIQSENFNENNVYYQLVSGTMTLVDNSTIDREIISEGYEDGFSDSTIVAGFYRKVTLNRGDLLAGYYEENGTKLTSGTCRSTTCTYYELIKYLNDEGNVELVDRDETYYFLATRDTNIIVLNENVSGTWNNDKPFTLTSLYNGVDYRNNSTWTVSNDSVNCYNDTKIENIKIYSGENAANTEPSSNSYGTLYGNWNNVKLGRGIISSGNTKVFDAVIAGNNSSVGSSNNVTKYSFVIESGTYNAISSSSTASNSGIFARTMYIESKTIFGSDYDRAIGDNSKLDVYYCASGSWGSNIYSSSTIGFSFDLIVKSGMFGSGKHDLTTGIYVGGRYGGTHYTSRKAKIEGGWIYNLIGGPLTASNRANYNDTYIYMTGGEVDAITGGAGQTATYGNRIIQVTGGLVNYNVFGGSNGSTGNNGDGTVNGSSFIYIGGDATIGLENYVNNNITLWGAEAGSIFGIGNGREGQTAIGSSDNSNIIIDEEAVINRNVYGGGNYGAVGISSTHNSTETNIAIKGGTIKGSIYGGGNNNGSGSESKTSEININMNGGHVVGSVYGGSNQLGTIYGNTNVNIYSGTIDGSVYGGGQGGYLDSNNIGTYVKGDSNVTIGNQNSGPIINRNVYGGSAFGTVNGVESKVTTTNKTNVKVYNGEINNSVFGGGEGNQNYTPYVNGDINVTIYGGTINNVYGGNDEAGSPYANDEVYIEGGTINNVYGGGNKTSQSETYIYINGGTTTNVYGGSNQQGIVNISNINMTSGIVNSIFGGNNAGGKTLETQITINGGNVSDVYGGGNEAVTDESHINILSANEVIQNIYGGGKRADVDTTNVIINGANIINVFGGSNQNGTVNQSNISITNGLDSTISSISNVYGGNNAGGKTVNSNLVLDNGNVITIFGGGNEAITDNVLLETKEGNINTLYGGGNAAAITNSSNVTVNKTNVKYDIFGGGNQGTIGKNTNLLVTDAFVEGNIYAGGNGASAVVKGNTLLNVDGTTEVKKSIFGGGNAAATGTETTNASKSTVNIAGAKVGKNVYGGANTSVLYGTVELNIGYSLVDSSLKKGDIIIAGTVFGGGEANASGSEDYDYSFISVTTGITINIDGAQNDVLNMTGSIFGSGNASSTEGYSYINISNYGTTDIWQKNISIQRADIVTLNNSHMELSGATDRTNDYSTTLFTLSRIKHLKLKNNSILYLQTGANLLEKFSSLVDINDNEETASVTISDNGTITRNVDNRIYMLDGKILNIATNQQVTAYGDVVGMTFFGRYIHDRNGNADTGLYDRSYNNNDVADTNDLYLFSSSSYVLARHYSNHDITKDGFYTNYNNEDNPGYIKTDYIKPTPDDASYYMWIIGEPVSSYDIELVASKYSTLGTYELSLINSSSANTSFKVVGFNYNDLDSDFELVNGSSIPRISTDGTADTKMGLTMKTSNTGWITVGETSFCTDSNPIVGTTDYLSENSTTVPSLLFYLYHSKNLTTDGEIGTVTISLLAITPIDDLTNDVSRININIALSRALYNTNDYEAAMTPGEKFDMFASTATDITTKSKLSAYYSLFVESNASIYKTGDYRVLVSSFVLPENTKITMVDLNSSQKEYYYYVVTESDVTAATTEYQQYGEASYKLSKFIKMDSTSLNNNYNDEQGNQNYYDSTAQMAQEDFVFIVDFKDSGISEDKLNNKLLLELRNKDGQTLNSVLGVQHANMTYNLYNQDALIQLEAELNSNVIYLGQTARLNITSNLQQPVINSKIVYDTNYFNKKMGVKISLYNSNGVLVNGASLLGVNYKYNDVIYYPRVDGTVRINTAERVANVSSKIEINTKYSNLASGSYTLKIESFGSADGIYYGLNSSDQVEIPIVIISDLYGLKVTLPNSSVVIDKETGKGDNGNNALVFDLEYTSGLLNPNIRVSMQRRKYDDVYSTNYDNVDLKDYVSNDLVDTGNYNYMAFETLHSTQTLFLYMKENLTSGTYKVIFSLYDGDTYIGEEFKYIIIK